MKNTYYFLVLTLLLAGCATKMAYLSTYKSAEEFQKDKDACDAQVNASDFKDPSLKQKKFNQCMQEKGYKVVSEEKAGKIQGFNELRVSPGIDFKAYQVIFIDKVDISQAKVKNMQMPGTKVTDEDIVKLGEEMWERFSKTLNVVMPVVANQEDVRDQKALYISLKLRDIAQTNVGLNAALQVAGQLSNLPTPGGSEGLFSFEATITDFSTKEKLITISDETKSDRNASLAGLESFEKWKHAYNMMDYWVDHLAALLAKERGQKYKSRLGIKLVDF